jgi:sugar phosphate isomerase/epimerase
MSHTTGMYPARRCILQDGSIHSCEPSLLTDVRAERLRYYEGSWRYTIPGFGIADWPSTMAGLDRMGYTGAVSIELEDHAYTCTLEREQRGIVKAVEFLSTVARCRI